MARTSFPRPYHSTVAILFRLHSNRITKLALCQMVMAAMSERSCSNVNVSCVTNGYTVGGTLTGLAASTSVTLSNNNAESITLSGDGSFSFTTPVLTYAVTVDTQPTGQACLVSQGSGTASANVTNVSVVCATAVALDCPPGEVITGIDGRRGGDRKSVV